VVAYLFAAILKRCLTTRMCQEREREREQSKQTSKVPREMLGFRIPFAQSICGVFKGRASDNCHRLLLSLLSTKNGTFGQFWLWFGRTNERLVLLRLNGQTRPSKQKVPQFEAQLSTSGNLNKLLDFSFERRSRSRLPFEAKTTFKVHFPLVSSTSIDRSLPQFNLNVSV
jgi:hypothetical protein